MGYRLRLFCDLKNQNDFVYNLGVSGDTSTMLLKRFKVEAKSRQPDIILISIGDNDSVYLKSKNRQMVSLTQFEKNLHKLIECAKGFTKNIVFIGCKRVDESRTNPVPWAIDCYYTEKNIVEYSSVIKKVCLDERVLFLDVYNLLDKTDLVDGLHPNESGHEKLFLAVRDLLIQNNLYD